MDDSHNGDASIVFFRKGFTKSIEVWPFHDIKNAEREFENLAKTQAEDRWFDRMVIHIKGVSSPVRSWPE